MQTNTLVPLSTIWRRFAHFSTLTYATLSKLHYRIVRLTSSGFDFFLLLMLDVETDPLSGTAFWTPF